MSQCPDCEHPRQKHNGNGCLQTIFRERSRGSGYCPCQTSIYRIPAHKPKKPRGATMKTEAEQQMDQNALNTTRESELLRRGQDLKSIVGSYVASAPDTPAESYTWAERVDVALAEYRLQRTLVLEEREEKRRAKFEEARIERVAKAIYERKNGEGEWIEASELTAEMYRDMARAALATAGPSYEEEYP